MSKSYTLFPSWQMIRLNAGLFIICFFLGACGSANRPAGSASIQASIFAKSPSAPVNQEEMLGRHPKAYKAGPRWSPELILKFKEVHVKIFPHNSVYTQPQGGEVSQDEVSFVSEGKCSTYAATTESSAGEVNFGNPLANSEKFYFSTKNIENPLWLVCGNPTKLFRKSERLPVVKYTGRYFIKKIVPPEGSPYLTVINVLPLEEYLKGVVPSEMPPAWSFEALKAQAVAARTYALFQLLAARASSNKILGLENSGAQLDDTVAYQAYLGVNDIAQASNRAVEATAGQVITYQDTLAMAFFHADSGGRTEDAANVWGAAVPYLLGKLEIYSSKMVPNSEWTESVLYEKIQSAVLGSGANRSRFSLSGMAVSAGDIFPSGRVFGVSLNTYEEKNMKISGNRFAHALKLRSTWFNIFPARIGEAVIRGRGFGHGVGMSQWGARLMAEHYRKSYEEILAFYYSGSKISKPGTTPASASAVPEQAPFKSR